NRRVKTFVRSIQARRFPESSCSKTMSAFPFKAGGSLSFWSGPSRGLRCCSPWAGTMAGRRIWAGSGAPETGFRMALGARQSSILALFVRQGSLLVLGGVALGIAVSAVLTRFLASMLFQVEPIDPLTFVFVPSLLAAVAIAAGWLPARRAMRVDP